MAQLFLLGVTVRHIWIYNRPREKWKRRKLRSQLTPAEKILWYYLAGRRFYGHKFRRQYSVGGYIIDFYCTGRKLAIEIDGDSHFTPTAQAYDEQRTKYIQSFGIMVIRFTNTDIYTNMQKVLDEIAKNLDLP